MRCVPLNGNLAENTFQFGFVCLFVRSFRCMCNFHVNYVVRSLYLYGHVYSLVADADAVVSCCCWFFFRVCVCTQLLLLTGPMICREKTINRNTTILYRCRERSSCLFGHRYFATAYIHWTRVSYSYMVNGFLKKVERKKKQPQHKQQQQQQQQRRQRPTSYSSSDFLFIWSMVCDFNCIQQSAFKMTSERVQTSQRVCVCVYI